MFGSGHFPRVFFCHIAHGDDLGLPVESVVVEIEFRVESEQLAFRRHDERIDLYHGTITLHEELEEVAEELGRLVHQRAGQPESSGDVARLVGHEPKRGIHADAKDFFRRLLGDRLDVHSAFRAGDDHRRRRGAVEKDGEVEFTKNVHSLSNKDLSDLLAFRTGLMGDQGLAEHSRGQILGLQRSITKVNATFKTRREGSLAPPSRMNLGLYYKLGATQF